MASVDKIKISDTTYDVSPSPNGTLEGYTSNDSDQSSTTTYTSIDKIEESETNSSIFGKITSMVRNIRYLYNKLGTTTMPEDTVTGSISSINNTLSGKAALSHSHGVADLHVSSSQVNSDQYIPTSSLIYSMNEALSSIDSGATMPEDITTNITCGGLSSGTSISAGTEIKTILKNMLYKT